jgi:glycosyltransferase involved in cell wall biosynthesis
MVEKKKLNILLSAFRCEPGKGGEPGVGWNFAKNMATYHNVWVLTRKSHKNLIDESLLKEPIKNLLFIYYDIPNSVIINEKKLGEQAYYILWQIFARSAYKKVSKIVNFDLIHHVTFNQYRSPSIGFFTEKPFIMGPIGGAETISPVFFQDLALKGKLKEVWRNVGLDIFLFGLLFKLRNNPKTVVFSSKQNFQKLGKYLGKKDKSAIIPAIAIDKEDFVDYLNKKNNEVDKPFTIIYSGTAKDWKGLLLLLRAIKNAFSNESNILVKLIGIRNENENQKVLKWIYEFGIESKVQLINFMPREQVIKELSYADISVYPAFRDSGSMSVLEACALGCTVLCFDAGGQDAFPDHILIKVPVSNTSYQANLNNLSEKLKWSYTNRIESSKIGEIAQSYVFENYTWQKKVITIDVLHYL